MGDLQSPRDNAAIQRLAASQALSPRPDGLSLLEELLMCIFELTDAKKLRMISQTIVQITTQFIKLCNSPGELIPGISSTSSKLVTELQPLLAPLLSDKMLRLGLRKLLMASSALAALTV